MKKKPWRPEVSWFEELTSTIRLYRRNPHVTRRALFKYTMRVTVLETMIFERLVVELTRAHLKRSGCQKPYCEEYRYYIEKTLSVPPPSQRSLRNKTMLLSEISNGSFPTDLYRDSEFERRVVYFRNDMIHSNNIEPTALIEEAIGSIETYLDVFQQLLSELYQSYSKRTQEQFYSEQATLIQEYYLKPLSLLIKEKNISNSR